MDKENKDLEVSPEEQKAEEEASKEVNVDELREKLAEDLGIDPETEVELLNKLVDREKSQRERLSGAIKQKISWREKAKQFPANSTGNPAKGVTPNKDVLLNSEELVDQRVKSILEQRDLESLNLPEELKSEVKDFAKLKNISVREASQLPYILSRKQEIEKEARIQSATPRRSSKGTYTPSFDPSKPLDPADFDFNSPEGIKQWNDAKAAKAKARA